MENKKILSAEEKTAWFVRYNESMHRDGRIWTLVCLGVLLAVPFMMGLVLGAMPDMNRFVRGFINVAIILIVLIAVIVLLIRYFKMF